MRVMPSGWPLIGKLCLVPVCVEERCVFSLQFPEASFPFFSCHPNIRHMECSTWLIPPHPQNLVNEKALLLTPVPEHPKEMVLFPLHHLYLPFGHWDSDSRSSHIHRGHGVPDMDPAWGSDWACSKAKIFSLKPWIVIEIQGCLAHL